jgi:putative transposase
MKNIVKLQNYYLPGNLINILDEFVEYSNNERYHESLKNLTPADVYFGREHEILKQRHLVKLKTMKKRRKQDLLQRLNL